MADDFANFGEGLNAPALNGAVITPSDSVDLTHATRAIRVSSAGDVKVTTVGGDTFVITAMTAGETLPIRVSRVWVTGTTVTGQILGLR